MPRYGEKLNEAVQNLRIKLYVMSFDSVQFSGPDYRKSTKVLLGWLDGWI